MKQIYSKVNTDKIIASIIKLENITDYRTDLSPENEYIQVSARSIKKGLKSQLTLIYLLIDIQILLKKRGL